ncbi:MAG: amino acid ABC transporter permease [Hyphomicrobiales bacterium]
MDYSLDFSWLADAVSLIGNGALVTVFLIVASALLGTLISVLGAAGRRSPYAAIRKGVAAYVELIRNTPFLAQLFFIYFGLPSLGLRLNPFVSAILAMTVNLAAYGIEIVGAGLDAVPAGQREAGRTLGLRPAQIFIKIVLPQALKVIFPALTSQIVITMLESAAVSQIAVRDLTYEADLLQARTFRSFETYLIVTLVYLLLSVALRRLMLAGDKRFLPARIR